MSHRSPAVIRVASIGAALALAVAGCASSATAAPASGGSNPAAPSASPQVGASGLTSQYQGPPVTLRLGYFPNITHATAIVGVQAGIFSQALGPQVTLQTSTFNAGSSASEALLSNAIDATFIGPSPAINAWSKSNGAVKIISGATSAGALLVVKAGITSAADLKGKKLATPQLGNTQDVALRTWLLGQGLKTDLQGGGDVSIVPQDNATTLQAFESGAIDGAWEPEPWASRLILEGHGTVLVNEKDLWPGGQFATTVLLVRADYLTAHPDVIKALLSGELAANALVNSDPTQAQALTNQGIKAITGTTLSDAVIQAAWKNLAFTPDPIASSIKTSADNAVKIGLLKAVDLTGITDLTILNGLLTSAGQPAVGGL
jgi:NitT/TauT family transport system substrate-binding protein